MQFLCIILSMCKAAKHWGLWSIAVILTFNTFQVSYAVDFERDSSETNCQHFQLQAFVATELDIDNPCDSEHKAHCFSFLGCTSSFNFNSMLSGVSYLEPTRASIKLGFKKNDSPLITISPNLLDRPPKH
jgi:hypothetical protein